MPHPTISLSMAVELLWGNSTGNRQVAKLPKNGQALMALLLAMSGTPILGQVESPTVGFSVQDIDPGNGTSPQLTLKAPQYLCSVEYQSISTGLTGTSLIDATGTWGDDRFNGDRGPHYIEIIKVADSVSDPAVGTRREIADTTESNRSLTISKPWPAGLTSPVTYRVVKHWTIRQLFGAIKRTGIASSISGSSLVDSKATWASGEYDGVQGPHFVEIVKVGSSTTHPAVGTRREVTGADGATHTLTVDQPWPAGLSTPFTYRIVQHMAERSDNTGNLRGGNVLSADRFQLWDGEQYATYYYQTQGIGGIGWRKTGDQVTDAGDTIIQPGQAMIFSRAETVPLRLVMRGVVKSGSTSLQVAQGFNVLANPYASSMTLASSALYTGSPDNGLAGGSLVSADQVLIWNGTYYDIYYYQTSGLGGVGWRKAGSPFEDAQSTTIPAASSVIVRRMDSRPFTWRIPAHPITP